MTYGSCYPFKPLQVVRDIQCRPAGSLGLSLSHLLALFQTRMIAYLARPSHPRPPDPPAEVKDSNGVRLGTYLPTRLITGRTNIGDTPHHQYGSFRKLLVAIFGVGVVLLCRTSRLIPPALSHPKLQGKSNSLHRVNYTIWC
ncbi:uncharacterized protein PODANS_6_5380 [Podospora anserina S mat+]|uniref:Podospora anserina S mat+ genomic DNA chromosome 6, supercontig 2 n=1 Tax=Podospora anserina (strain S / ATCC MYA-4624 / DSM 980 / FGSC 10383) TaxID=515849 RepID=B2B233_PODAN|nr:uncharacterized protein PODANS_6_5380 [Podospora anserina S mat+]CAP71168.1 unnamed protein product [Podospora anserina S mat+]CDP30569.1 Putative protein of unknown function [Podospora anserina S mat+]